MLVHILKEFIAWLHLHPHLAGMATFLIALGESLAVIGLLIPGSVLMTAIGTLMGAGILPIPSILIWAILGSIAGDSASYWIGRHFKDHVRDIWPFRKYPYLMEKGEAFFKKHGGKSVFLGRFVGPVRPIVPMIAGMMAMRARKFIPANVISALLWAPFYMLPGMLIGAAAQELPPEAATRFVLFVLTVLIGAWLAIWLTRHIILKLLRFLDGYLDKLWIWVNSNKRLHPFYSFIQDPQYPKGHGQLTLLLLFITSVILFTGLAYSVTSKGIMTHLNMPTLLLLRSFYTPMLHKLFTAVSMIGKSYVILPLCLTIPAWLIYQKKWFTGRHLFFIGVLGAVLTYAAKYFFHIARPEVLLVVSSQPAFPSGHATLSTIVYGFIAVIIARQLPRKLRYIPYVVATCLIITILFSRIYLEMHWMTDIMGGTIIGLGCVFLFTMSYRRRAPEPFSLKGFLSVMLLTLAITYPIYFATHYKEQITNYVPYWPTQTLSQGQWWEQAIHTPVYRRNRIGHEAELMNLQWAGDIQSIQNQLLSRGWAVSPSLTVHSYLQRYAHKDQRSLPLMPRLYLSQKPVLTLHKKLRGDILILRLWDAHVQFTDASIPLWYGTIQYLPLTHHHLFSKQNNNQQPLVSANQALQSDLGSYEWKSITIKHPKQNFDGKVLIIRQSD